MPESGRLNRNARLHSVNLNRSERIHRAVRCSASQGNHHGRKYAERERSDSAMPDEHSRLFDFKLTNNALPVEVERRSRDYSCVTAVAFTFRCG